MEAHGIFHTLLVVVATMIKQLSVVQAVQRYILTLALQMREMALYGVLVLFYLKR